MLTHQTLNCAAKGCYAVITLHPDDEERLRRTHETFYCPAGHTNYFPGKTKQEKQREELERQLAHVREMWERSCGDLQDALELARDMTRAVQVCPLGCGWHTNRRFNPYAGLRRFQHEDEGALGRFFDRVGSDLREHLVRDHNATVRPVTLLSAGDPAEARTDG